MSGYVEEDSRFAEHAVLYSSEACEWKTYDGVTYSASVAGQHEYKKDEEGVDLYEAPTYLGRSYKLGLEISYGLGEEIVPEELREYLQNNGAELPDDIKDITVTYEVQLGVSPANQLSWQAVRFYDIEYTAKTVDDSFMELVTDPGMIPVDYSGMGMEVNYLSHMRVALMQDDYAATPLALEALPSIEETEDEMFARLVDQFIESFNSDPRGEWLTRAIAITEMVQFRSEGDFDLATVFPPEVLEAIREG